MKKIKFKFRKLLEKFITYSYLKDGYDMFTITVNGKVTDVHFYKI